MTQAFSDMSDKEKSESLQLGAALMTRFFVGCEVVLLVIEGGQHAHYVASTQRTDTIAALRQTADRLERKTGSAAPEACDGKT